MRPLLTWTLTLAALLVTAGCGAPPRGPILKDSEKFANSDRVFREIEYYQNRRGEKIEHGRVVQYYENGKIFIICEMRDGKKTGRYEQFYPTGEKEFGVECRDGWMSGKMEKFHRNGKLAVSGLMVKSLQDGLWTYYDEGGKVLREEHWKQGELLGK